MHPTGRHAASRESPIGRSEKKAAIMSVINRFRYRSHRLAPDPRRITPCHSSLDPAGYASGGRDLVAKVGRWNSFIKSGQSQLRNGGVRWVDPWLPRSLVAVLAEKQRHPATFRFDHGLPCCDTSAPAS